VPELPRSPLASLAVEHVRLAEAAEVRLPACAVYDNIDEFDPAFATHMRDDIYVERTARLASIDLVRLPSALVQPGIDYIVTVDGHLVEEQYPPYFGPAEQEPLKLERPVVEVPEETVIVARYGVWTWGHWLGELLPKLAMAEAAFPGRFHFAVPHTWGVPAWRALRESIAAYGVSPNRVLLLDPRSAYALKRAWAVTPIWSDHVMHPQAADTMRRRLAGRSAEPTRKLALLRQHGAARQMVNWVRIADLLAAAGYEAVDIASLDFAGQVRCFREATHLFSTLGSGLSGLIYSPRGVRVTSVAPHIFGDRFFYALVADRHGRYADVRGPVVTPDPAIPHRGSFSIEPSRLLAALEALEKA
jgi:hypothetical protein